MAQKSHVIRVYNCSNQLIPLQIRVPNSDFYTNEQQVRLMPNSDSVLLPKSLLRMEQINNLKARRLIKVIYDSEVREEREAALNS